MNRAAAIITLIIGGIIFANLIAHSSGTQALFGGIETLWSTTVNGLLGKTS